MWGKLAECVHVRVKKRESVTEREGGRERIVLCDHRYQASKISSVAFKTDQT